MEKHNEFSSSKRIVVTTVMILFLLLISIGYAYLSANLTIKGTGHIDPMKWDIHFANVEVSEDSIEATTPISLNNVKTEATFGVSLEKPGDKYAFNIDTVNGGTIDAVISDISIIGLTEEQEKYMTFKVTYYDGTDVQIGDTLIASENKTLYVEVTFKSDINVEDLPKVDDEGNLLFSIKYVQDVNK